MADRRHPENLGLNDSAIRIEEKILKDASQNKKISTISNLTRKKTLEDRLDGKSTLHNTLEEKHGAKLRAQLKKARKKKHDQKHGHCMGSNESS
ncbi:hypothetical protein F4776DRAFT_613784 [Hypoxylon sp. NC0597]|nr:hypothetical protein F4776DRAFT_613784 [Hypoxylon sp. NC0597]